MIDLKDNELIIRFPELHDDAVCRIDFQRTLRLPDDNRKYPLPPGLGRFPLEHIEGHSPRLPTATPRRIELKFANNIGCLVSNLEINGRKRVVQGDLS